MQITNEKIWIIIANLILVLPAIYHDINFYKTSPSKSVSQVARNLLMWNNGNIQGDKPPLHVISSLDFEDNSKDHQEISKQAVSPIAHKSPQTQTIYAKVNRNAAKQSGKSKLKTRWLGVDHHQPVSLESMRFVVTLQFYACDPTKSSQCEPEMQFRYTDDTHAIRIEDFYVLAQSVDSKQSYIIIKPVDAANDLNVQNILNEALQLQRGPNDDREEIEPASGDYITPQKDGKFWWIDVDGTTLCSGVELSQIDEVYEPFTKIEG